MQRTVSPSEFCPSVRPSVRCVYCDKTKQRTVNILIPHEMAISLVFWHQQWLVGNAPFPLKSALKVTHPVEKRQFRPISAHNVSTVGDSGKSSITTNIKSTTSFPMSHRWSAYVTPKCPKGWLKDRVFRFLSKGQQLIVSSAVFLLSRSVSQTSDGQQQYLSHHRRRRRDLYSAARPSRRNNLITTWCRSVSGLREAELLPPFTRAFWISSRWHHMAVARSLSVS